MEWKLAFEEYHRQHPEIGEPIVDIQYLPPDWARALQYSVTTVLVYTNGKVYPCPEPGPAPGAPLFFEDSTFYDVGPWLTQYAEANGLELAGLIGLIHAESAFNPFAVRRGVWPDVSGGFSQMTIQTAAGYGLGDGSATPANVDPVLDALCDRETGIRLASEHYAMCLGVVDAQMSRLEGDERLVMGLRAYNGGTAYGLTPEYASAYPSHIAAYEQAVALAHQVLRGKGWE